jgi:starvation-inducible outer membrane lipoprotein
MMKHLSALLITVVLVLSSCTQTPPNNAETLEAEFQPLPTCPVATTTPIYQIQGEGSATTHRWATTHHARSRGR